MKQRRSGQGEATKRRTHSCTSTPGLPGPGPLARRHNCRRLPLVRVALALVCSLCLFWLSSSLTHMAASSSLNLRLHWCFLPLWLHACILPSTVAAHLLSAKGLLGFGV